METFDHTICLGMVGCSAEMLNSKLFDQFVKKLRFELGSAIGDDGFRNSVSRNPVCNEVFCNCSCRNIALWNGFEPASLPVDHGEEISVTFAWR